MDTITERMDDSLTFDRPFPPLTPAQRYHLDVYGYVVIENTLKPAEASHIKDALYRLRDELKQLDDPSASGPRVRDAFTAINKPHHHYMANLIEADPVITAYATHPFMVSMAEELIGGEARIVEMNAHINRRDPDQRCDEPPKYNFHRGTDIPFASYTHHGLFHCNFVKTLTNLTDLGPDDGGTVVVAGSHKIDVSTKGLVKVAYEDRSLIHQVVAPAGSTLLFSEALVHATGQIRSDKERAIIITGYGSTLFPYWDSGRDTGQLSESFRCQIPQQLKILFEGKASHKRGPRFRLLSMPADARQFELGEWNQRRLAADR